MKILILAAALLSSSIAQASGMQFHEIMRGKITVAGAEGTKAKKLSFKLDVIAMMEDIDAWASSPEHPATLAGKAYIDGLMIPVTGTLNLAVPGTNPDGVEGNVLHYHFASEPEAIPSVSFDGIKFVPKKGIGRYVRAISQLTTLRGNVTYQLDAADPIVEAPAKIVFPWYDPFVMMPFLFSFKIHGAHGNVIERGRVRAKFIEIYFGGLYLSGDLDSALEATI